MQSERTGPPAIAGSALRLRRFCAEHIAVGYADGIVVSTFEISC
jgi:hypothetical protein